MPHSQSNLSSLASLLESAEARHSALPPALAPSKEGSGVIDIVAMQRRAQEERARPSATATTRTPLPTVSPVPDPDVVAAITDAQRRKKRFLVGAVAGGAVLVGVAIGILAFTGGDAPAKAAAVEPKVVVVAPPAPPAPPAAAAEPPAAPPAAAAAAEPAPRPTAKKAHKSRSSQSKGPKMTKVTSGGTPG